MKCEINRLAIRPAGYSSEEDSEDSDYYALLPNENDYKNQRYYADNDLDIEINASNYDVKYNHEEDFIGSIIDGNLISFNRLFHEHYDKVDLNTQFLADQPPILILACLHPHYDIIECIIQKGVDCNIEHDGVTPLIALCTADGSEIYKKRVEHYQIAKLLIQHNASINFVDSHLLSTPFLWACRNGHIETVKYLISLQQTDLMARDYKGRNALMLAIEERQEVVVFYLMKRGLYIDLALNLDENMAKILVMYTNLSPEKSHLYTQRELTMKKIAPVLLKNFSNGSLATGVLKEVSDLNLNSWEYLKFFKTNITIWDLYEKPNSFINILGLDVKTIGVFRTNKFNNLLLPFFNVFRDQRKYGVLAFKSDIDYLKLEPNMKYTIADLSIVLNNLCEIMNGMKLQIRYFEKKFINLLLKDDELNKITNKILNQTKSISARLDIISQLYHYNKCNKF